MSTPCTHPLIYGGLCAQCNQLVESPVPPLGASAPSSVRASAAVASSASTAVVLGGSSRTIHMSASALADRVKSNSSDLLQHKRLLCVLDLDHTLLHATSDANVAPFVGHEEDLFSFQLPENQNPHSAPRTHFVKLRPGLTHFLQECSNLFDMHVYTMGARNYADAVVPILDPSHKFIKNRVVSRDESGIEPNSGSNTAAAQANASKIAKSLRRMHPCDEGLICILDDRTDVWTGNAKNVVKVYEFHYFSGRGEMNARPGERKDIKETGTARSSKSSTMLAPIRSKPYSSSSAASAPAAIIPSTPANASPAAATTIAAKPAPITTPVPPIISAPVASAAAPAPATGSSGIRRRKGGKPPPVIDIIEDPNSTSKFLGRPSAAASSSSNPIVIDDEEEKKVSSVVPAAPVPPPAQSSKPVPMDLDYDDDIIVHPDEADMVPFDTPVSVPTSTPESRRIASLVADAIASSNGNSLAAEKLLNANVELTQIDINRLLDAFLTSKASYTLSLESTLMKFFRRYEKLINQAPKDLQTVFERNTAAKSDGSDAASSSESTSPYETTADLLPIHPNQLKNNPIQDNVLISLTNVLRAIHALFYWQVGERVKRAQEGEQAAENRIHTASDLLPLEDLYAVPRLIATLKRTVLEGCVIVFSGVYIKNNDPTVISQKGTGGPQSEAWIQATQMGALCLEEFPAEEKSSGGEEDDVSFLPFGSDTTKPSAAPHRVTHVVAARAGSAKLKHAASMPKEIRPLVVHVSWLWNCMTHFQKADENLFPLEREEHEMKSSAAPDGNGSSTTAKPSDNHEPPTPARHLLYNIHYSPEPASVESLVARGKSVLLREAEEKRNSETVAELTLARENVLKQELKRRTSMRSSDSSSSSKTPARRVSFNDKPLGVTNPSYNRMAKFDDEADGGESPSDASPSESLKRKAHLPLDDVDRVKREKKFGKSVHPITKAPFDVSSDEDEADAQLDAQAKHEDAQYDEEPDTGITTEELYADPNFGQQLDENDLEGFGEEIFGSNEDYARDDDAFDDDN